MADYTVSTSNYWFIVLAKFTPVLYLTMVVLTMIELFLEGRVIVMRLYLGFGFFCIGVTVALWFLSTQTIEEIEAVTSGDRSASQRYLLEERYAAEEQLSGLKWLTPIMIVVGALFGYVLSNLL